MAVKKYKLGELIEPSEERNTEEKLKVENVRGISTEKAFIETKANMDGVSLSNYKIVKQYEFAYVPDTSRRGDKISLAYNKENAEYLVSSISTVFHIKKPEIILSNYLFIYFNRPEFDRFSRFNSWGSARETFSWEDLCDIDIELPDLPTQRKYVQIYESIVANQKNYEKGLDDLKLTCDAYIEELRRKTKCEKIGPYISKERKNSDGKETRVLGIGQSGFMQPQKEPNESLKNYKLLQYGDVAYAPPLYNVLTGALHCYTIKENAVCSPIYEVFKCDERKLLPTYLTMWLKRDEFKRYAAFYALGVRQTFDYQLMEEVQIPIPDISVQRSIADIYKVYTERKRINEQLKQQIKNICPILIKGSLEE